MQKILAIFAKNTVKSYGRGIIHFHDGAIYLFDDWKFTVLESINDITVIEKEKE